MRERLARPIRCNFARLRASRRSVFSSLEPRGFVQRSAAAAVPGGLARRLSRRARLPIPSNLRRLASRLELNVFAGNVLDHLPDLPARLLLLSKDLPAGLRHA